MRRVERRLLVGLLVLVAHALLLWAWPRGVVIERAAPGAQRTATVVAISRPPPPAVAEPRLPASPSPANTAPARRATASQVPAPSAVAPDTAAPKAPREMPIAIAPSPPEPAASTLDLRLRLAPGQAPRGGLTEPPGSARALALNDPRSNVRHDPTRDLPDAVAASAKGDCLKGEYAGYGLGPFSLPFLAYHLAAGHCRPQR